MVAGMDAVDAKIPDSFASRSVAAKNRSKTNEIYGNPGTQIRSNKRVLPDAGRDRPNPGTTTGATRTCRRNQTQKNNRTTGNRKTLATRQFWSGTPAILFRLRNAWPVI